MRKFFYSLGTFAFLLSTMFTCTACPGPDEEFSVSPTEVSLSAAKGSSATFYITTDGPWKLDCSSDWIDLSPKSGSGNATITVKALSSTNKKRTWTVYVKGEETARVEVSQEPMEIASLLEGTWVGKLKRDYIYNDCFIKITRISKSKVRIENLICERFDINLKSYNLNINETDSSIDLYSESNTKIEGHYYPSLKELNLNFVFNGLTYWFEGTKE